MGALRNSLRRSSMNALSASTDWRDTGPGNRTRKPPHPLCHLARIELLAIGEESTITTCFPAATSPAPQIRIVHHPLCAWREHLQRLTVLSRLCSSQSGQ